MCLISIACFQLAGFFFHQPTPQLQDVIGAGKSDGFANAVRFNDDNILSIFEHHVTVNLVHRFTGIGEDKVAPREFSHLEMVIWRLGSQEIMGLDNADQQAIFFNYRESALPRQAQSLRVQFAAHLPPGLR